MLTLINYVQAKGGVLFGSERGPGVEKRKRKAWEEIAVEVRGAGGQGVDRGGFREVRSKWNDLVYRAKKYKVKRLATNKTGEFFP